MGLKFFSRQNHINLFLIGIGFLLFSCSKNNSAPQQNLSSAKAISAFSFDKSNNSIPVSSSGTISGTSITIFLPPGTAKNSLKASFTISANASVTVNGAVQTSGSTAVDFSNAVNFVVKAQDGSTQTYSVTLITDIASIDNTVNTFMNNYNLPGLSLAISKDENLVYVKGYGEAISQSNQAVTTQSLFRIASLSKQITSIAIMKLLDQGKIKMTDKVFGSGSILGTDFGTQPYGTGISDITVDELLHHTAGGWPNDGTDPMFSNPAMTASQLITWTLDNMPLDHTPGTNYEYSNFGYCVLGRVIEKITGQTYADAVNTLVLQPCGITDMSIAGNTLADRITNEVEYYGQSGENPYIYNIKRMDSHGGWLASATDLARILVHVDGFSNKADILSSNAITVMTTPSSVNAGYACGWSVNNVNNWWHQGSLPGTASEQARTVSQGKYNFVILTNTRSLNNNFSSDLDQLFWNALAATSAWPGYDLF
ncbi:MAG TPA: serine hydrolase domain-containing protein [Puia sp.]|nr:serine hydrolase domain-containing protein [Puia sp.]